MKKLKYIIVVFIIGLMVGCSASEGEVLNETKLIVENTFNAESKEPVHEGKGFSYFLPDGYEVESEKDNNVVLITGKQTVILFVNLLEDFRSNVVYDTTKENVENVVLTESFEGEGKRFGYLHVRSIEKNLYELSVGVGGVKVTTQSSKKDLVTNAENMMMIANSVEFTEKDDNNETNTN